MLLFLFISQGYLDIKNVNRSFSLREKTIVEAINNGEKEVKLDAIVGYTPYSCYEIFGDLNYDSSIWPNTAIARYYGLDLIAKK